MWQKCPLCNGSGCEYNSLSVNIQQKCSVCNGKKIINQLTGNPPVDKIAIQYPPKKEQPISQTSDSNFTTYQRGCPLCGRDNCRGSCFK